MAQLSDDCFDDGGRLITTAEALTMLGQRISPVAGVETVRLREALGRTLAEDVVSPVDIPPHDNAAVDGYAIYFEDLDGAAETELPVGGRAAAGHPLGRPAKRGEAIRIFTGAPIPDGPDTVMMQEDCIEAAGRVRIAPGIKRGANRRDAGEDVTEGTTVLRAGTRLRPQEVGQAAAVGRETLQVYLRLSAAVFSTGDEIIDPGETAGPGRIYDSNRYIVMSALSQLGCAVSDLGILADDPALISTALRDAAGKHDLLVTTGGMSVGEEDHVKAAIEADGKLHFWRLAIKPGRPVALGQLAGTPFIGLPGNPVAAMVTLLLVGRPMILRLGGAENISPTVYKVRADFDHEKKKDRREFIRARLTADADGVPIARKHGGAGAGILSSLVGADGLVALPEDMTTLEPGGMVDFLPFSEALT